MFNLKEGLKGGGFIFGIIILVCIVGLFICVFGSLFGAGVGFIVSICPYINNMVINGFMTVGYDNVNLMDIGAMIGFISGIFGAFINAYNYKRD